MAHEGHDSLHGREVIYLFAWQYLCYLKISLSGTYTPYCACLICKESSELGRRSGGDLEGNQHPSWVMAVIDLVHATPYLFLSEQGLLNPPALPRPEVFECEALRRKNHCCCKRCRSKAHRTPTYGQQSVSSELETPLLFLISNYFDNALVLFSRRIIRFHCFVLIFF